MRAAWDLLLVGFLLAPGRADVLVLELGAIGERRLVFLLVALEAVAGVGLGVFLAGVGLGGVLGYLVASRDHHCERGEGEVRPHALPPSWSASMPLPP